METVKVKINGIEVEVQKDATILEAAHQAGVRIPTLCYLKKINAIAQAAGVEVMLGCMTEESGIAINASAALGAALKNITRADLDATFSLKQLPFEGGLTVKDTCHLVLSSEPGLGITGLHKEMLS